MLNHDKTHQIQLLLDENKTAISVANLHALLSGYLCGGGNTDINTWTTILCDTPLQSPLLGELCAQIDQDLSSIEFQFNLLLPEDNQPIQQRAHALVSWIKEFLTGLGLSGANLAGDANPDVHEGLQDLSSITHLDYQHLEESEESEQSLVELIEYVRSVVMYLYTELRLPKQQN